MRLRAVALAAIAALAGGGCSVIGGGGGSYELTAEFERTINLFETSQVRVLGLPAGSVKDISVDGDVVRVVLRIDDDVPVPDDVQATIVPFSLIGERYVQLFPAWTEGEQRAADGDLIPLDRTTVPVEPDEALAALKEFLDTLDPDGTGRLVENLGEALDGQGDSLNGALEGLGTVLRTFGDESDEIAGIVESFDEFTATLVTRDAQLGRVMDQFAAATSTLADERRSIEALLSGLATLSSDALDLVAEHDAALSNDLQVLGRALRSVDTNLDSVSTLLDAGPILVDGLIEAHSDEFHRLDLRNQASPTVQQAFDLIGLPVRPICLPIDVDCSVEVPAPARSPSTAAGPAPTADPAAGATSADAASPPSPIIVTPIDSLVSLLGSRAHTDRDATAEPAESALAPPPDPPGFFGRLTRSLLGVGW